MAPQSLIVVLFGWGVLCLFVFNDFDSEHEDVNDFFIDTKYNITLERDLQAGIHNALRG